MPKHGTVFLRCVSFVVGLLRSAPIAADSQQDGDELLREGATAGFPVHDVNAGALDTAAWSKAARHVLPHGLLFDTPEESRALCRRSAIGDVLATDLQQGARLSAAKVAAWVRDGSLLRNTVSACPQVAMLLLLLHVEASVWHPEGSDLNEAIVVQVQYNVLKSWLQNEIFVGGAYLRAVDGWPLEKFELRIYRAYQRQLSDVYNDLFPEEDDPDAKEKSVVVGTMVGSWRVVYDNRHTTRVDIAEDGYAVSSSTDGPGGAELQVAVGADYAAGWQYSLSGHYRAGKFELLKVDEQGRLVVRHWTGSGWHTGMGERLGSAPDVGTDRREREHVPSRTDVMAATEPAEALYDICPEARFSSQILAYDAGGDQRPAAGEVDIRRPVALRVEGPMPVSMGLIGNALSLYWQARGLAWLAGAAFAAIGGRGVGTFVEYLPRTARPAEHANSSALQSSCRRCGHERDWRWPHLCLGAWTHILGFVRAGMRRAFRATGTEAVVMSQLRKHDVAIHFRCFPFFHDVYPLAGFSFYLALPAAWRTAPDLRFLLVAGKLTPVCRAVAEALESFLIRHHPQAEVERRYSSTTEQGEMTEDRAVLPAVETDFVLLANAPVLFRTPSSFSLWAALAREEGERGLVFSTPNLTPPRAHWQWETADFGPHWHWIRTPLLSRDVAQLHGYKFEEPSSWIPWLESH